MEPLDKVPFIETIDDLGVLLSSDGFVQTDSNQPAYGVIRVLSGWHPRVHIMTEEYYPDAVAILAHIGERPELQPNAMETMAFDPEYWGNKLDAYPHWETAWWREVVQNARDARGPDKPNGPSRIDLDVGVESFTDVEGETVEAVRCSCTDDGVGMDEDTLRRAFLSFGGTMKPVGAVGGFGDAKELIIIPWLGYEIHTRNLVARGRHNQFEISPADRFLDGTRVTAWMPTAKSTTEAYAEGFIDRCNLPDIAVRINGKRRKANLSGGDLVLERAVQNWQDSKVVGAVRIYHYPRSRRRGVLVRSNGIYMFDQWVDETKYKGVVYIELEGAPRDIFSQKRTGFSGRTNVDGIVDTFIARMTVDVRSALKKMRADKGKQRMLYMGTGTVSIEEGLAADVAAKMAMDSPVSDQKKWKDGSVSFDSGAIDAIKRALMEQTEGSEEESFEQAQGGVRVRPVLTNPSAVEVVLRETRFASEEHAADALRLMAWQPIFLLVNDVDFFTVPPDVSPEKMKPSYQKLAELWMEICRFVLMRLGWTRPFGIGWAFEWDEERDGTRIAAYTQEQEVDFLLLNPVKLAETDRRYDKDGDVIGVTYKKSQRWKTSDDEMLKQLCAVAVHEATHMVNGIDEHNEAYASALTENMGALMDMLPVAKKIRKAIGSKTRAASVLKKGAIRWDEIDEYELRDGSKIYGYDANDEGVARIEVHPAGYYLWIKKRGFWDIGEQYDTLKGAKAAATKRVKKVAGKKSAIDVLMPRDANDPWFYRLWFLYLYAVNHMAEDMDPRVAHGRFDAQSLARSYGSGLKATGQPARRLLEDMEAVTARPLNYVPEKARKVSRKVLADQAEWEGREAWSVFVHSLGIDSPLPGVEQIPLEDFLRPLTQAVVAAYDPAPLLAFEKQQRGG